MKKSIIAIFAIALFAAVTAAQTSDEQQIMSIHKGLEQAYVKGDTAPFESVLADEYMLYADGKAYTRTETLDDLKKEIAKPTYKQISEESDGIKIKVAGETAYVTSGWTSVTRGLADGSEPHTDKGRYVGIYEKRNGKWMLMNETFTEAQHDRKLMEQQVLAASAAYDTLMKSRDKAAYERLLHADYTYTSEDGKLVSRADDIAYYTSGDMVINTVETTDKKVRITGNSSAVETGVFHATGAKKGKPFEETGRYTTTWVWRDLRWQIIADHNSLVKK